MKRQYALVYAVSMTNHFGTTIKAFTLGLAMVKGEPVTLVMVVGVLRQPYAVCCAAQPWRETASRSHHPVASHWRPQVHFSKYF
jgi:hypothetical protein